jgi:SET domain-containing protein
MLSTKVEVKNMSQDEKGLFALEEIKKGEVVWKLDPSEKVLTESERDNLPKEIKKLAFRYKSGFVIIHDKSEYTNHSYNI